MLDLIGAIVGMSVVGINLQLFLPPRRQSATDSG